MIWFLTGVALILHITFWGMGLTFFILPRRWLRLGWVIFPMSGLGLQSGVVLAAAQTELAGAKSYALFSLALPAGLLLAASMRLGARRFRAWLASGRKLWGLWLIMAFCLAVYTYPMARISPELTSISMGSCDAADYAAGARVFQDFARSDRSGFLGMARVPGIGGLDNFQDYWLRLNHFTPSALMALNGEILHSRPHKLASLFGAILAALALPVVFLLARSGFCMRPGPSLLVTLLYGCNPIVVYAIYHCALGQLIAAPAVALLTWTGLRSFHGPSDFRSYLGYTGLLVLCNWLILGAYNFFILFSYVPLLSYVAWQTLRSGKWGRAARWTLFAGGTLGLSAIVFADRVVQLPDRFRLLSEVETGWRIAAFRPSGWYGLFRNGALDPATSIAANLLSAACFIALALALIRLVRQRPRQFAFALAWTIPVFVGYGLLVWQGQKEGEFASYDAYKLFAVFLPGLLISFCLWLEPRGRGGVASMLAFGLILLSANLALLPDFARRLEHGLIVDRRMVKLSNIERMPEIKSVNVNLEVSWSRLWANYFLLRTPHYFRLPAYEARSVTPLLGDWDLRENFLVAEPQNPRDKKELNQAFYLIDRRRGTFLDLHLAGGWHGELDFHQSSPWAWGGESPQIEVTNPHPYPLQTMVRFSALSLVPRAVQLQAGAAVVWEGALGTSLAPLEEFPVEFPPGPTLLEYKTATPGVPAAAGDRRLITVGLHRLNIRVLENPVSPIPATNP